MKKAILFALSVVFSFGLLAQAEIEIDKSTIKFPKTKEGILLKHTYQLTNTGDTPLLIQKYEVSCSCTKAEFQKTPVLPNQAIDIIVTFDTKGKIGWQDRVVTLHSNAKDSPTKIRFKVMIDNK